ncbi:hypothetical protein SNE40_021231 [Patella caerulea]|uniref:Uncharacterized protein n=1 Tax=Patella caerulea TaxID=87958 RepID=A0AAN8J0H3_PATCE
MAEKTTQVSSDSRPTRQTLTSRLNDNGKLMLHSDSSFSGYETPIKSKSGNFNISNSEIVTEKSQKAEKLLIDKETLDEIIGKAVYAAVNKLENELNKAINEKQIDYLN